MEFVAEATQNAWPAVLGRVRTEILRPTLLQFGTYRNDRSSPAELAHT